MPEDFDPYHKWLGIAAKDQPPHHYRLLNIEPFEDDADAISNAADARMAQVKQYQSGKHSAISQRILNELAAAKVCLLNGENKAEYDADLRDRLKPHKRAKPALPKATLMGAESGQVVESPLVASRVAQPSEGNRQRQWLIPVLAIASAAVIVVGLGAFVLMRGKGRNVAQQVDTPSAHSNDRSATDKVSPGTSDTNGPAHGTKASNKTNAEKNPDPTAPKDTQPADPTDGSQEGPTELGVPSDPGSEPSSPETPDSPEEPMDTPEAVDEPEGAGVETPEGDPEPPPDNPAPPPDPVPPKRLAMPDPSAQRRIRSEVREIFKQELDEAKAPAKRSALAKKLLEQANASEDDPNTRFVVLRMACDLAAEAGNVAQAMHVVDMMQRDYDIKPLTVRTYVLTHATEWMASGSRGREVAQQIVGAAMVLADKCLAEDQYLAAAAFTDLALSAARKTKDGELIQPLVARNREINRAKARFGLIRKALEVLAANPDDPEANLTAGRWYCFNRRNWEKGLPMLAKGSDEELAKAARQDADAPTQPASLLAVGDAWWDVAEKAGKVAKEAAQARVQKWYNQVLPSLEGLDRVKVKKRLEKLAAAAVATEEKEPTGPTLRGFVQPGNVALATNGTVVTGAGKGGELIDGNSTKYTGSSGFATGSWPCTWTITFDKVYRLKAIRFLLWDRDSRYYRYAVATSEDGSSYTPLVDHTTGQWRGWQPIPLRSRPVKSVKIFGTYNSANSGFYIVEFEAYCVVPR